MAPGKLIIIVLGMACFSSVNAKPIPNKAKTYLKVKAIKGQGIYGLLRSYNLLEKPGNLELFYKINGLDKDATLVKNQEYKLPVTVHSFDGKSIRSSIGTSDLDKARQIEKYNKELKKSEVKKQLFKDDKVIWVPVALNNVSSDYNRSPIAISANKKANYKSIAKEDDPRKHFLTASFVSTGTELIADHKMSDDEISQLKEFNTGETAETTSNAFSSTVASKSLKVSLFGDKYGDVSVTSQLLNNQVFYIVPGHGGPDPGAMAKNVDGDYTICEDEYAYDVCLRLAKNLIEKGATVYVIVQDENDGIRDEKYLDCDCDEKSLSGRDIPLSQKKRLKQGISYVNKLYNKHQKAGIKKQWMVTLHIDAQSEENRQDVFFYYQSESELSKQKALDIQKVFEEKYQLYRKEEVYNGTVTSRPLYVVRHSNPEPIFIELANIHNPEDRKRILYPKNRQLIADWITEGFID
jgi:N-acetylmuramoyl-L-alanine amidase